MGLWMLFNTDTFRSSGLNFHFDMKNVHDQYDLLLDDLCELGHHFIKWPTQLEQRITATYNQRHFGFPGAALMVDGTLIKITAPQRQKQRYVDRHHNYSMNVQIVCDHRRLIRDVYIGQPGSVHDARVFRRSPVAKCLYSRDDMLHPELHILGDSAYVLTDKVITPYRDNGQLTPSHRYFNQVHSQCRSIVERTIGLLKNRFGRLRRLYCKDIRRTVKHIGASCVLSNYVLLEGHEIDGVVMAGEVPAINVSAAMDARRQAGQNKRTFIRLLLEN